MAGRSSTWIRGATGVSCVVALGAILIYSVILPQQRQRVWQDHLRRIGLALQSYQDLHHSLPPAYVLGENGKPAHSWRALLLPFLGEKELYDAYDFHEPWDGPHNRKLAERVVEVYRCPDSDQGRPGRTNVVAIVGSQTMWPGPECVSLAHIPHGTSATILLMELVESDIGWTEPRDVVLRELLPAYSTQLGTRWAASGRNMVHVVMCDGSIRRLENNIARSRLFASLTRDGGNPFHGKWLPGEEDQ